jgi:hypothetical protein
MSQPERDLTKLISNTLGELPSRHRQFVSSTLQMVSAADYQGVDSAMLSRRDDLDLRLLLSSDQDCRPWIVPTASDVESLSRAIGREGRTPPQYIPRTKYRLSAASVAIRFLEGLSTENRSYIRNIRLNEDRASVAWPQCHAQGLIPFCQANPLLRVERRLSLWSNGFREDAEGLFFWGVAHHNKLKSKFVSRRYLAPWIMEALALPTLGMPPQSFALVLDGKPKDEKASHLFDSVVQRDATWQRAFETWLSMKDFPLGSKNWLKARKSNCYIMKGFPQAVGDIIAGASFVKCTFDAGEAGDEQVVLGEQIQDWTADAWNSKWKAHKPVEFSMEPPLPT